MYPPRVFYKPGPAKPVHNSAWSRSSELIFVSFESHESDELNDAKVRPWVVDGALKSHQNNEPKIGNRPDHEISSK